VTKEKIVTLVDDVLAGWGISNNGNFLILSDGTNKLFYINPISFDIDHILNITVKGKDNAHLINEILYEDGIIYSHILNDNHLLLIDAKSGLILK
jgi:glutamine cyclotransferase